MTYKIVIDRNKCQGIGACVNTAPEVFKIDKEGKAIVISADGTDEDTVYTAADSCPLEAISLFDEDDEKVYP